mmetsp:Transcript_7680/g.23004  ORF Transcript_7680/g.23004 Transcript_7680/m.23004 type:complete len:142 (+) Transcript_7680:241-666(+)
MCNTPRHSNPPCGDYDESTVHGASHCKCWLTARPPIAIASTAAAITTVDTFKKPPSSFPFASFPSELVGRASSSSGELTKCGNSSQKMAVFLLNANEARARACLSARLFSTDPTVGVDSSMNDRTPLRIVPTDHAGTHDSG